MDDQERLDIVWRKLKAYEDALGRPSDVISALDESEYEDVSAWIEAEMTDDGATTPEDLANLLEVHQQFIHLRDGRREQFNQNGSSRKIAAIFFGLFARQELDEKPGHTGVTVEGKRAILSTTTGDAKSALEQAERDYDIDLLPADGQSTAVKRGMLMAVRLSHPGQCDDPESCTDGLFGYRKNEQHTLRVKRPEFNEYLREWQQSRDRGQRAVQANSVVSHDREGVLPPTQSDRGDAYTD